MVRSFYVIVAVLLLAFTFTSCWGGDDGGSSTTGGGSDVIKIGFAGPLSGDSKDFGEHAEWGAELAVALINEKGGINGSKVELVSKNDEGLSQTAGFVARELYSDKSVLGVVGHLNSRCTLQGAEVYNKGKIVQITYGSTNPTICKGRPYTFRNIYTDDDAGMQMADFCKESMKATRVSVYYENDAYGKGLAEFFMDRAKEIGLEVVYNKSYDSQKNPDYKSALQGFMAKNPEVLFISGAGASTSTICKIAKELNPELKIISGDGSFQQSFINGALDKAEGAVVSGPADFSAVDSPEIKAFTERYKKTYGKDPSVWAFQSFDAVGLLAHAIEKAGADREAIAKYMSAMTTTDKGYTGVTGNTYFNEHGDPVGKSVNFFVVKNQKFVLYK